MQTAFQIDLTDNVATALCPLAPGETRLLGDAAQSAIEAVTDVPVGHKIALRDIPSGGTVLKYGESIGIATKDIQRGDYVHVHNLDSARARGDWKE